MVVGVGEKLRRPVKGHVQAGQKGARSRALEDHRRSDRHIIQPQSTSAAIAAYKASWEVLCERFM